MAHVDVMSYADVEQAGLVKISFIDAGNVCVVFDKIALADVGNEVNAHFVTSAFADARGRVTLTLSSWR